MPPQGKGSNFSAGYFNGGVSQAESHGVPVGRIDGIPSTPFVTHRGRRGEWRGREEGVEGAVSFDRLTVTRSKCRAFWT